MGCAWQIRRGELFSSRLLANRKIGSALSTVIGVGCAWLVRRGEHVMSRLVAKRNATALNTVIGVGCAWHVQRGKHVMCRLIATREIATALIIANIESIDEPSRQVTTRVVGVGRAFGIVIGVGDAKQVLM